MLYARSMEMPADVKRIFGQFGRRGGRIRMKRLSAAARRRLARKAAKARWGKRSARR